MRNVVAQYTFKPGRPLLEARRDLQAVGLFPDQHVKHHAGMVVKILIAKLRLAHVLIRQMAGLPLSMHTAICK
jgi:hypothetical protein